MHLKAITILWSVLLIAVGSRTSVAGLILSVDPPNAVTNRILPVGTTFIVDFFLVEDGSETRLTSDGLFSFDFRGLYDSNKLQLQSIAVDPAFDLIPGSDTSALGRFDIFGATSNGTFASSHQIHLGSVHFQSIAVGSSIVSLIDNGGDGFLLNDFQNPNLTVLDPVIFGANLDKRFDLQITAVPEPSSIALVCLTATTLLLRSFRCRQSRT